MKEYQVKITPKAKDDMEEIYNGDNFIFIIQ